MGGFSLPLPGIDEDWGGGQETLDPTRRRNQSQVRSALANLTPWDMASIAPTSSGKALDGAAPNNVSASEMEQNAKKANPLQGSLQNATPRPTQAGDDPGRPFNPDLSLFKPGEQQEGPPNSGQARVFNPSTSQFPDVSGQIAKNQTQIDAMNQPMTGKQKIFKLLEMAAPVALGGIFGGFRGAAGAAGGVTDFNNQQNANKQRQFQLLTNQNDNLLGLQERGAQAQQEDEYKRDALGLMKRPEVQQTPTGPIQYDPQTKTWSSVMVDGKPIGAKTPPQKFTSPAEGYAAAVGDAISRGADPEQDPKVMQWKAAALGLQKGAKPDTPEQQFIDEYQQKHKGAGVAEAVSAYSSATQKPERPQRQLAIGPDGKVMELTPGMTVPTGSKTVSGDLAAGKATPDEQKRGDLASNMKENLDALEEIVNRRPDLFGPAAGRMTDIKNWFGSGDKDIGALKTIEHQLGMVQQSTHGMRSAQGVQAAADSLINSFHSKPEAVKGAISAARNSIQTFIDDVNNAKNPGQRTFTQPASKAALPSGAPAPQTHTFSLGAWKQANPKGDAKAAKAAAQAQGFTVTD